MIDLEFAMKAFEEYRKEYPDTERINLKVAHMKRVMQNNIQLAKSLKLSEENVALAGLIGILHDIGRFEQVKRYDSFIDSQTINHAMFSSEQLFEQGLIRRFIIDDTYDHIIKAAIENHNRFEIEAGLNEEELLQSKLIRDSDKVDIYIQVLESDPKLVFDGSYSVTDTISQKVFEEFMKQNGIKTADMQCKADDYVRKMAFIYGLYFPESLRMIKEQDLLNRLTKYFKESFEFSNPTTIKTIDMINNIANTYIKEKVNL